MTVFWRICIIFLAKHSSVLHKWNTAFHRAMKSHGTWNQTVPEDDVIHVFFCICKHANARPERKKKQEKKKRKNVRHCMSDQAIITYTQHEVFVNDMFFYHLTKTTNILKFLTYVSQNSFVVEKFSEINKANWFQIFKKMWSKSVYLLAHLLPLGLLICLILICSFFK